MFSFNYIVNFSRYLVHPSLSKYCFFELKVIIFSVWNLGLIFLSTIEIPALFQIPNVQKLFSCTSNKVMCKLQRHFNVFFSLRRRYLLRYLHQLKIVVFLHFKLIYECFILYFYVTYHFQAWGIMALHNILSIVTLCKRCLFAT